MINGECTLHPRSQHVTHTAHIVYCLTSHKFFRVRLLCRPVCQNLCTAIVPSRRVVLFICRLFTMKRQKTSIGPATQQGAEILQQWSSCEVRSSFSLKYSSLLFIVSISNPILFFFLYRSLAWKSVTTPSSLAYWNVLETSSLYPSDFVLLTPNVSL